jgi:hypothetical protein
MFQKWHDYNNLPNMDDLIYVKFIDQRIGFGVFAKQDIHKYSIIGEYTGII